MSIDTGAICTRCNRELIYSIPPQESDTTTKKKIDDGYYRCKPCIAQVSEERKQDREHKKQAKKQKLENIKQFAETKVETFNRYWRDVNENGVGLVTTDDIGTQIVNLGEQQRLMWIYKRHDIRKPDLGFLSTEEAEVIRREQIQVLNERAFKEIQKATTTMLTGGQSAREQGERQIKEIEAWKKMMLKKQVAYVDALHTKANKEWESKPHDEWERMVKKPGFRDPEGNRASRYHLLSDKDTFHLRQALRNRQIANIERVDKIEDEISKLRERTGDDDETAAATT